MTEQILLVVIGVVLIAASGLAKGVSLWNAPTPQQALVSNNATASHRVANGGVPFSWIGRVGVAASVTVVTSPYH